MSLQKPVIPVNYMYDLFIESESTALIEGLQDGGSRKVLENLTHAILWTISYEREARENNGLVSSHMNGEATAVLSLGLQALDALGVFG